MKNKKFAVRNPEQQPLSASFGCSYYDSNQHCETIAKSGGYNGSVHLGDAEFRTQQIHCRILCGIFLFLTFFSLPVLADDALVLPARAWRFYLIPAWTLVKANFDAAGERQAIALGAGRIETFNLGYAIEYGITKWLTTGIQWSPGAVSDAAPWTAWTSFLFLRTAWGRKQIAGGYHDQRNR